MKLSEDYFVKNTEEKFHFNDIYFAQMLED